MRSIICFEQALFPLGVLGFYPFGAGFILVACRILWPSADFCFWTCCFPILSCWAVCGLDLLWFHGYMGFISAYALSLWRFRCWAGRCPLVGLVLVGGVGFVLASAFEVP